MGVHVQFVLLTVTPSVHTKMYAGREGPRRTVPDRRAKFRRNDAKSLMAKNHRVLSQTQWRWSDVTMRCSKARWRWGDVIRGDVTMRMRCS